MDLAEGVRFLPDTSGAVIEAGIGVSATLEDRTGRPQYLPDHREPISELVG
jgi:hypothetical protein